MSTLPPINVHREMSLSQLATESPQAAYLISKNCPKFPKWSCFFGAIILAIGIYLLTQVDFTSPASPDNFASMRCGVFGFIFSCIGASLLFGFLTDHCLRRNRFNAIINMPLERAQLSYILALEKNRTIQSTGKDAYTDTDIQRLIDEGKAELARRAQTRIDPNEPRFRLILESEAEQRVYDMSQWINDLIKETQRAASIPR